LPSLATAPEIARITRHADLELLIAPRRYLHHDYIQRIADAFPAIAGQQMPYSLRETPFLRMLWFWCDAADDCPPWAHRIDLGAEATVGVDALAAAEAAVHS